MANGDRICIILTGGIGDFIASLPALHRIHRAFPGSKIVLVGNPLWLPLAEATSWIDEIRSVEDLPLHAGFASHLPRDHALSRFLADFDLVISWFGDKEGLWEKNLQGACPGRLLVHPYHRVHTFEGHASDFYLATLDEIGLPDKGRAAPGHPFVPLLRDAFSSESNRTGNAPSGQDPFLCLHPGSGSAKKNWPKERFLEAARGAFRRWHLPSSVMIGPAEHDQQGFWNEAKGPTLFVAQSAGILETARVIFQGSLYVGNDSGITHLAAAIGTPVVALFGPTDPARWAPRGGRVEILGLDASAEQVLDTLGRIQEDSSIIL